MIRRLPLPDLADQLKALAQSVEEAGPEAAVGILPDVERWRAQLWLRFQAPRTMPNGAGGDGQEWLTIETAAERLGVNASWIYHRTRTLPFMHRLGSRGWRVSASELDAYLRRPARRAP